MSLLLIDVVCVIYNIYSNICFSAALFEVNEIKALRAIELVTTLNWGHQLMPAFAIVGPNGKHVGGAISTLIFLGIL